MYNGTMTKRVYVETSVISGMFDRNDHPAKAQPFWDAVKRGEIRVVLSDVLAQEIAVAPQHVREFFDNIPTSQIERIVSTVESNRLAAVYITAGIVSQQHLTDCKHIVHNNRIARYNAFNVVLGYPEINILTPDKVN